MDIIEKSQHWDRTFLEIKQNLNLLDSFPEDANIATLTNVVDCAMNGKNRNFHNSKHVFELLTTQDPVLNLAAIFHDVIYFQVDQGFPKLSEVFLKQITTANGADLFLATDALAKFPDLAPICSIFSISPGEKLNPLKGLNEFLSAAYSNHLLGPYLSKPLVAQIAVCIEGTIPFRAKSNDEDPMINLFNVLSLSNRNHSLGLNNEDVVNAIKRAVALGNLDVQNFASHDHSVFLATTWQLMPERNESLRDGEYTIKDYRQSLQKMCEFFHFLSADLVFKKFKGFPNSESFEIQRLAAKKNIEIARSYLKIKLVAIAVLESLAEATGGDLPMRKFLGAVFSSTQRRMERSLPIDGKPGETTHDSRVYELLNIGRSQEVSFDLKNSPLAAYLYPQLSIEQIEELFQKGNLYFRRSISANEYLGNLASSVLAPIFMACSISCQERGFQIMEVLKTLTK